jgi:hypothetical protein
MKHFVVIFTALLLFCVKGFAQDFKKDFELEIFKSPPTKMEAVAIFTYDTASLTLTDNFFVVQYYTRDYNNVKAKRTAYLSIKDKPVVVLKYEGCSITSDKKRLERYSAPGFNVTLKIDKAEIFYVNNYAEFPNYNLAGTLEITSHSTTKIKVIGQF